MSKPKRKRWSCPTGDHPGVLGPGRPRANSIVRYCLPCSEKSGVLVERVCAANEKERARKTEAAKAKAQKKKVTKHRQDEKRFFVEGIDLRDRAIALCNLKAWKGYFKRNYPDFIIRRRAGDYTTGRAWKGRHRVVLTVPIKATRGQAESLILHELAHLAAPARDGHGKAWRQRYAAAVEEAWGVGVGVVARTSHGLTRGITAEIDKKLKERKQREQEKQRQKESAKEEETGQKASSEGNGSRAVA